MRKILFSIISISCLLLSCSNNDDDEEIVKPTEKEYSVNLNVSSFSQEIESMYSRSAILRSAGDISNFHAIDVAFVQEGSDYFKLVESSKGDANFGKLNIKLFGFSLFLFN